MAKKRHTAEQIISKLREAEVLLAKSPKMPQVCRKLAVTEQTYYRRARRGKARAMRCFQTTARWSESGVEGGPRTSTTRTGIRS